jgi:glycosidase
MGESLKDLKEVLDKHFQNAVGGVHILPFFPSSADRGFAPLTYREVDPNLVTGMTLRLWRKIIILCLGALR